MVDSILSVNKQQEWPILSGLSGFGWCPKKEQYKIPSPPPAPKFRNFGQFAGAINEQENSSFMKLPAEIRNEIYQYVFGPWGRIVQVPTFEGFERTLDLSKARMSSSTERDSSQEVQNNTGARRLSQSIPTKSQPPVKPAHPLSFLLTCRKINLEASGLAFKVHPFAASGMKFYSFRQRTYILPRVLFNAITHLAYDVGFLTPYHSLTMSYAMSDFLTNSMCLFPTVKTLDIIAERGYVKPDAAHPNGTDLDPYLDLRADAINRYVPAWMDNALRTTVNGHSFSWQKGEKWQIEYGLFESEAALVTEWYHAPTQRSMARAFLEPFYIDKVDGLVSCVCGCGRPTWVTARLVQETGRIVNVQVIFVGPKERVVDNSKLKVKLIPHVEPLPVNIVEQGSGIMWDGDEDFWIDVRARNGGVVAKMQSFWRKGRKTEDVSVSCVIRDEHGGDAEGPVQSRWTSGRVNVDWSWINGGRGVVDNGVVREGN